MRQQTWRKSSYSGDYGNCVEVASVPGGAAVRDSKAPERGRLELSALRWDFFLSELKDGRYDG